MGARCFLDIYVHALMYSQQLLPCNPCFSLGIMDMHVHFALLSICRIYMYVMVFCMFFFESNQSFIQTFHRQHQLICILAALDNFFIFITSIDVFQVYGYVSTSVVYIVLLFSTFIFKFYKAVVLYSPNCLQEHNPMYTHYH